MLAKANYPRLFRLVALLAALSIVVRPSVKGLFVGIPLLGFLFWFDREFRERDAPSASYYWLIALVLPLLAFGLLSDAAFLAASLSLASFSLAVLWEWSGDPTFSKFLKNLENRVRTRLSKFLSGQLGFSFPTLLVAIAVSTAFFAWFADGVKEAETFPWLPFAALAYALTSVLALDIYYLSSEGRQRDCKKTLVGFLSKPKLSATPCPDPPKPPDCHRADDPDGQKKSADYKLTAEDYRTLAQKYSNLESLEQALRCNALVLEKENKKLCISAPNVLPAPAILWNEKYKDVQRVEFIVADDTVEGVPQDQYEGYKRLLTTLLKAAKKRHGGGEDLEISFEENLMVESYDVVELYKKVNRKYDRELAQCSHAFVFNLTGGTSAMSAAITLVAIRGLAKGVYVKQASDPRVPLWDKVVPVTLDIYDISESAQEPGE